MTSRPEIESLEADITIAHLREVTNRCQEEWHRHRQRADQLEDENDRLCEKLARMRAMTIESPDPELTPYDEIRELQAALDDMLAENERLNARVAMLEERMKHVKVPDGPKTVSN